MSRQAGEAQVPREAAGPGPIARCEPPSPSFIAGQLDQQFAAERAIWGTVAHLYRKAVRTSGHCRRDQYGTASPSSSSTSPRSCQDVGAPAGG